MSTKSNVRLPLDGILSPSPRSFQKHLQNLAYGSLPSIGLSGWHLKPISDSLLSYNNLESSIRLIPQRTLQLLQMASISPFPHHQSTASANFQVYSGVQSSSTSRSRKAKHANLTLPVQED